MPSVVPFKVLFCHSTNVYWVPSMLLAVFQALDTIKYFSFVFFRTEPEEMSSLLKNIISENRSKDREEKGAYVKMIPMLYQASESYPNNCFSVLSCCITKEDLFYLLHLRFPPLTLPRPLHFIIPPHIIPHLQATNHFGDVAIGKLWGSA